MDITRAAPGAAAPALPVVPTAVARAAGKLGDAAAPLLDGFTPPAGVPLPGGAGVALPGLGSALRALRTAAVERRIDELVKRMTPEELAGQLTQLPSPN